MGIKILNADVTEQIAAGEVVENPASVVKELVENSLDAGAETVEVRLKDGGLKEIRVTDDGSGIPHDEAALAFERHATSKISQINDLSNIKTLGFRGEALASIGAVSRVSFTTRTPGDITGTIISLEGGCLLGTEETGAPPGTEIKVSDLFYNTPARLAFLKSRSREMKRVSTLLTGMAFSYPEVAFYLWSEERLLFKTVGDGNIPRIIAEAYGGDVAEGMTVINPLTDNNIRVSGYISTPLLTRSTRLYQTVLINRRLVRSNLISHALNRGYGGLLSRGRFPLSVIYIEVPPESIDVNIHPAKAEVRFHNDKDISDLVYKAVTLSLGRSSPSGNAELVKSKGFNQNTIKTGLPEEENKEIRKTYSLDNRALKDTDEVNEQSVLSYSKKGEQDQLFPDESYRIIGQFLASYIIAQKAGELILIDQHAAHERILYEKMRKTSACSKTVSVSLASPLTVEIPFSGEDRINEIIALLEEAGFKIESFGYNTIIIRSIPVFLTKYFNRELFTDLMENMMDSDELPEDKKELIFRMASCKGAVKANHNLSRQEMTSLVSELENTDNPYYCPHGRPAVISFNIDAIEKSFRRKGGRY